MRLRAALGVFAAVAVAGLGVGVGVSGPAGAVSGSVRANDVVQMDTSYEIVTTHGTLGSRCANVIGGSTRPGALLQIWRCVGSANELFRFSLSSVDGGVNWYQIRNDGSGLCFELPNESGADGTPIEQANCAPLFDTTEWRIQIQITDPVAVFSLVNKRFPTMCLTRQGEPNVPRDNDRMVLSTCQSNNPTQFWRLG